MLTECWECGASISDAADACPRCGAPAMTEMERRDDKRLGWRIVGAVWLMIIVGVALAI